MKKEKDITIRVSLELKTKLQEKANALGISVSSYIRMVMIKELSL